jgi:ADP-ribose pyrophosphatase
LKLDEGEDLSGTWFNLEEVENISQDMKTILALHLFKSL